MDEPLTTPQGKTKSAKCAVCGSEVAVVMDVATRDMLVTPCVKCLQESLGVGWDAGLASMGEHRHG